MQKNVLNRLGCRNERMMLFLTNCLQELAGNMVPVQHSYYQTDQKRPLLLKRFIPAKMGLQNTFFFSSEKIQISFGDG